jgi:hypothetical protein
MKGTSPVSVHQPDPPPMQLQPIDDTTFLAVGDDPDAMDLPVVFFDLDDDGRPGFVHMGARATPRVADVS